MSNRFSSGDVLHEQIVAPDHWRCHVTGWVDFLIVDDRGGGRGRVFHTGARTAAEAVKDADEFNAKHPRKNAHARAGVLLLEAFESVDLFAILVDGRRRRYFLDEATALAACKALNELGIGESASVLCIPAYLPAARNRVAVGTIYESMESRRWDVGVDRKYPKWRQRDLENAVVPEIAATVDVEPAPSTNGNGHHHRNGKARRNGKVVA